MTVKVGDGLKPAHCHLCFSKFLTKLFLRVDAKPNSQAHISFKITLRIHDILTFLDKIYPCLFPGKYDVVSHNPFP